MAGVAERDVKSAKNVDVCDIWSRLGFDLPGADEAHRVFLDFCPSEERLEAFLDLPDVEGAIEKYDLPVEIAERIAIESRLDQTRFIGLVIQEVEQANDQESA